MEQHKEHVARKRIRIRLTDQESRELHHMYHIYSAVSDKTKFENLHIDHVASICQVARDMVSRIRLQGVYGRLNQEHVQE